MRILIVARADHRKRYNYLLKPLNNLKIETYLLIIKKSIIPSIRDIVKFFTKLKYTYVVFIGSNVRVLIPFILFDNFSSSKLYIRSGGLFELPQKDIQKLGVSKKIIHTMNVAVCKYMFGKVSGLIAMNKTLCADLSRHLNHQANSITLPQFVEDPAPLDTKKFIDTADKLHLLTVTNLNYFDKYKGLYKLITSVNEYALSLKTSKKITYTIAGGGKLLSQLKRVIESLDLPDQLEIIVLGHVKQLAPVYSNADIFLYFSTYDGLPNVLLEAQSHGLPILINHYKPFFDYLVEGDNAIFFNSNEPEDMISKLAYLDENIDLRERMGTINYRNILNNYTLFAVTKLLSESSLIRRLD